MVAIATAIATLMVFLATVLAMVVGVGGILLGKDGGHGTLGRVVGDTLDGVEIGILGNEVIDTAIIIKLITNMMLYFSSRAQQHLYAC